MHAFTKKGSAGTLTVLFMNIILKCFLHTLVEDSKRMPWITYITLRPPINWREARAAVEALGWYRLQWSTLFPQCQMPDLLIMCAPPCEDGVPVIQARDAVDADAFSDGPVPVVLSED